MKLRVIGTGVVMTLSLAGVVAATPATSYAAGCYTGCHTSTPKSAGGKPASTRPDGPAAAATTTQAQALAFTGANVLIPTGIGGGAIVVGGVLMYVGRRRRYSSAS
ncbi:MAG: hypothetical protein ACLP6E_02525 [Acidimicrobiales bacterium]